MVHTILGKKAVSFTASDGRVIEGTTIYVGYEADGVDGLAADKLFVTPEKMPQKGLVVGTDVDLLFNRYGKVDRIIVE